MSQHASAKDPAWPTALTFHRAERRLDIVFSDDFCGSIPYQRLREHSPSAEVRGHGGQRPPQLPVPADIDILEAEPVGRYAVRLIFSDGHRTGLYSWTLLRRLAEA